MTEIRPTLHPATAEWKPTSGPARQVEVSSEQLYGRACIVCGSVLDGLMDAGYVYTRTCAGDPLPWPVKACPHHTAEETAA